MEDRFRKTNQGSPEAQSKQTGKALEPPVPSRSESFSNGNSEPVQPALQRPMEPQVKAENLGRGGRNLEAPVHLTLGLKILAYKNTYLKCITTFQSDLLNGFALCIYSESCLLILVMIMWV